MIHKIVTQTVNIILLYLNCVVLERNYTVSYKTTVKRKIYHARKNIIREAGTRIKFFFPKNKNKLRSFKCIIHDFHRIWTGYQKI